MKSTAITVIGTAFIFLATLPIGKKIYPEVKLITINDTTLKESMQRTPLYIKTIQVEDTINETARLIKVYKDANSYKSK
jgi:hypothetical protein